MAKDDDNYWTWYYEDTYYQRLHDIEYDWWVANAASPFFNHLKEDKDGI